MARSGGAIAVDDGGTEDRSSFWSRLIGAASLANGGKVPSPGFFVDPSYSAELEEIPNRTLAKRSIPQDDSVYYPPTVRVRGSCLNTLTYH